MTFWFLVIFPLFALWGVLCAYALKIYLSGEYLYSLKFIMCMYFNGFLGINHFDIVMNSNFFVLGRRPDIVLDYPFITWIAYAGMLLHFFAYPVRRPLRWWF
ncbi:hypothetical protein ACW9H6_01010 [Pseudomonas sp. SDO528_S397]